MAYVKVAVSYLLVVVATLAWRELGRGGLRLLLGANAVAGAAVAVAGIGAFVATGDAFAFQPANSALAVFGLLILVVLVVLPARLADRYLSLRHRGVLAAGTLLFAVEALWANLSRGLGHSPPRVLDALGFAVLLFSFGYVALQAVMASEQRLASIESELAVARRLQLSILPTAVPQLAGVRVAAAYEPMAAVAGDFYEFIPVDSRRAGFLVADVSGHGVPAALIASMIKVAVQSVSAFAADPAELLRRLGAGLHGHLRGQYVTAAYLWLDAADRTARYSAAGHPPLLHWHARSRTAERIVSNGLLFGVTPEADYPACEVAFEPGDRFLLYTDGLIEAERASGEAFGDARLEQVLRESGSRSAPELMQDAARGGRRLAAPVRPPAGRHHPARRRLRPGVTAPALAVAAPRAAGRVRYWGRDRGDHRRLPVLRRARRARRGHDRRPRAELLRGLPGLLPADGGLRAQPARRGPLDQRQRRLRRAGTAAGSGAARGGAVGTSETCRRRRARRPPAAPLPPGPARGLASIRSPRRQPPCLTLVPGAAATDTGMPGLERLPRAHLDVGRVRSRS